MSPKVLIRLSLIVNYMVFAVLLNSVGAVILQVQRTFDVSKADASVLEGFKDLPIAVFSFIVASLLPKVGLKKGMLSALFLVAAICFIMPVMADQFWYFKLLFAAVGISFAVIKVSVFAMIGLVTNSTKEHSSLMSTIEGFFMVGVLVGNVFFSLFVNDADPSSRYWLNIYWYLGAMTLAAALLLFFAKINESESKRDGTKAWDEFLDMLQLVIKPLVLVFAASAFLFVLIEQSFMTWTPTFYQDVLRVPASMGIQAGAVLAGALAIGRLLAGIILKRIHWLTFTLSCTVLVGVCVLLTLPLTANLPEATEAITWFNAPFVVYLFPILGLFLAPIYPTINSVVLSALPKYMQSSMSGLIVVFSALGGTTGSIITGHIFEAYGGTNAFYFSLAPIAALCLILILLNKQVKKNVS
ncbi:putative trehalose permease, MFS family, FucP subfamily [Indibacter alkaliphilus LW1]|uniref:Trehalose permease, MFS family, FucP subfamily n=1 Tax=Indibacter alkaliphilus (strain CCUG 57479 / KCTC 22604 / LW1) TaxID=1189612 RepID=S2DJY0_INDAL|nr:MFS transporter [Indibacter alkaliphilus]EOZ92306.1 putative trehalose permease, MFS family, FucP subfamily [Indibacter alkaliphilus LW1]